MFNLNNTICYNPQSTSSFVWEKFLQELVSRDPKAPFFVVLAYFSILDELDISSLFVDGVYFDIAMMIASDDHAPANEVATKLGFLEQGLDQIVQEAAADPVGHRDLVEALKFIVEHNEWVAGDQELCDQINGLASVSNKTSVSIELTDDKSWWKQYFIKEMLTNANTPTSVLGYYLGVATGQQCTIFCPLGWDEYERVGKEMAANSAVLDAAVETGLMTTAVAIYVGAALDVIENWDIMRPGVAHILNDARLRCFVPFDDCYVAEALLHWTANRRFDESEWYEKRRALRRDFSDAEHGYTDP